MRKQLLLIIGCFFLLTGGCSFERLEMVETPVRPDILWGTTWLVEERLTQIDLSSDDAFLQACCLINYQGDETVKDVRVMMASPLTNVLIAGGQEKTFDIVRPGDKLEFSLDTSCPDWRKKVPTAIITDKLIDDFRDNVYVSVCWKKGADEHYARFYAFGGEDL